jgi:polyprenyldihydroxybenzoate methyltransferase / 3-demethylubiquinol 3-O-methyltransferase
MNVKNLLNFQTFLRLFSNKIKLQSITNNKRLLSTKEKNGSSSIDDEEMKRFKLLSNTWWTDNGGYEGLHRMNELRIPLIRDALTNYKDTTFKTEKKYTNDDLLREPLLGLNVLDVGCGGGILSEPLARLGANVTGIDTCKENIIACELRAESEIEKSNGKAIFYDRLRYLNCSIEDLASVNENTNYFDAIVMSEVVEHVNNLNDFLTNSTKLLKVFKI